MCVNPMQNKGVQWLYVIRDQHDTRRRSNKEQSMVVASSLLRLSSLLLNSKVLRVYLEFN